jgi:hypothetical protein
MGEATWAQGFIAPGAQEVTADRPSRAYPSHVIGHCLRHALELSARQTSAHSIPSLIRLQLSRMSDNPDRSMKNATCCS